MRGTYTNYRGAGGVPVAVTSTTLTGAAGGRGRAAASGTASSSYRPMYASVGQRGGGRGDFVGDSHVLPSTTFGRASPLLTEDPDGAASTAVASPPPRILLVGATEAALRAWPLLHAAGFCIAGVVDTDSDGDGANGATACRAVHTKSTIAPGTGEKPPQPPGEAKQCDARMEAATRRVQAFIKGCIGLYKVPFAAEKPQTAATAMPTAQPRVSALTPSASAASTLSPVGTAAAAAASEAGNAAETAGDDSLRGVAAIPSVDLLFAPGAATEREDAPFAPHTASQTAPAGSRGADAAQLFAAVDFVYIATGDDFFFHPPAPTSATGDRDGNSAAATSPRGTSAFLSAGRRGGALARPSAGPSSFPSSASLSPRPERVRPASAPVVAGNREGFLAACVARGKHLIFVDGAAAADTGALAKAFEHCVAQRTIPAPVSAFSKPSVSAFVGASSYSTPSATSAGETDAQAEAHMLVASLARPSRTDRLRAVVKAMGLPPVPSPAALAMAASSSSKPVAASDAFTVSSASSLAQPLAPPPPTTRPATDVDSPKGGGRVVKGAVGHVKRVDISLCLPAASAGVGDTDSAAASGAFPACVRPVVGTADSAMASLMRRALQVVDALMGGRTPAAVQCRPLSFVSQPSPPAKDEAGATAPEDGDDVYVYEDDDDDDADAHAKAEKDDTGCAQAPTAGVAKRKGPTLTSCEAELFFEVAYPVEAASEKEERIGAAPPTASAPNPSLSTEAAPTGKETSAKKDERREGEKSVTESIPVKLYLSVEAGAPHLIQELTVSGTEGTVEMHDGLLDVTQVEGAEAAEEAGDRKGTTATASPVAATRDISRSHSRCVVVTYVNGVSSTGARLRVRQEKTLFAFAPSAEADGAATATAPPASAVAKDIDSDKATQQAAIWQALLADINKDEAALNELAAWRSFRANVQSAGSGAGSYASLAQRATSSPSYGGTRYGRGGGAVGRGVGRGMTFSRYRSSFTAAEEGELQDTLCGSGAPLPPRFRVKDSRVVLEAMREMLRVQLVYDKLREAGRVLQER